jgi:hypothetical protein
LLLVVVLVETQLAAVALELVVSETEHLQTSRLQLITQ